MKGNFEKIINSEKPVLIDFHALWCGPCKLQAPILQEISGILKDQVRIIKIDVDKNPDIAAKYQIRAVPTLIVFRNDKPAWRQSGVVDKQNLLNAVTSIG